MQVIPDSTHRIVLTKEIRNALNLKPGEPLNVSISAGAVFLTPSNKRPGKLVRKGKIKVYTGKIPNMDVEEAINKSRQYPRL